MNFAETNFAETDFAETSFAETDFTKETDDDDDDDNIANDLIDDSEDEMKEGENFSMKKKKLNFCNKKISRYETFVVKSSLLNLRC